MKFPNGSVDQRSTHLFTQDYSSIASNLDPARRELNLDLARGSHNFIENKKMLRIHNEILQ